MPATRKAREDVIQILNKTWSPCCSMREGSFTAFGSTPMADLLRDLDMGKKLDVLLVQQGDLRHIIKTIAAMNHYSGGIERKVAPDQITFRFVDAEPANIARNALVFELLEATEDKTEDIEFIWNVWFNSCLSEDHLDRVHGVLGNLIEEDRDFQLERSWKFADEKSKIKVNEIWKKWIGTKENGITRKGSGDDCLFKFESYSTFNPNISRRYATKWPYKKFEEFQRELDKWNKLGVLDVSSNGATGYAEKANPTMFRKNDVHFNVDPKLCPLAVFCPLKSADVRTHSSLTETCFAEFVKMVRDMKTMMKRLKVQINFEIGDSLEYLSSHKERKYNLIHTSNMADDCGLTNTLLVCEPLLKQKNSVLITTTEVHVYIPRKDYIMTQTGTGVCNLPIFLGIHVAENLSLGQNFIGKDCPVQTYKWVKCTEANPTKVFLKESPEVLQAFRGFFNTNALFNTNSAMSLAAIVKRFQDRSSDSPGFVVELIKDILIEPYLKSFHFVCKVLGIIPSKSLRIVKATLDGTRLGITRAMDANGKVERLILMQPSLFLSMIPDIYQTDTYFCDRESQTITLLMEEEEYHRKLKYNIYYTSTHLVRPFLSEIVKGNYTIVLDESKPEYKKTDKVLVKEQLESYIVTVTYKGNLVKDSPSLVYDKRPCRVSVCFTDSNGKNNIPVVFIYQITSEFHSIDVEKSTRQIHFTLYKECLQRMGNHLLPSSSIDFESTESCTFLESEACGILGDIETRNELLPKPMKTAYMEFSGMRAFMQALILKRNWITETENAVHMQDISTQQMLLKIDGVYNVGGYPVADVTFLSTNDISEGFLSFQKASHHGWKFCKRTMGLKMYCLFSYFRDLLLKNSKRVSQDSPSNIPGFVKSFLDIRFSDLDDAELPKIIENTIHYNFRGDALQLDSPRKYARCSHCLKIRTSLLVCAHCGEAAYCDDKCKDADFVRHTMLSQFQDKDDPVEANIHKCKSCGQNAPTSKACSQCKAVYYCDRKCQEKDWPNHKKVCKKSNLQTTDPKLKRNLLETLGTNSTTPLPRYATGNVPGGSEEENSEDSAHNAIRGARTTDKAKSSGNAHDIDTEETNASRDTTNGNVLYRDDCDHATPDVVEENLTESAADSVHSTGLHCANCRGSASNLITCTVCSTVSYCGYQCQLTHWPQHHKQCVKHLLLKLSDTL